MHKSVFIFGGAVLASLFISLFLFSFLDKSNLTKIITKYNPTKTVNLLTPLTDKQLSSAFVTYNIETKIQKVELSAKGVILSIDNPHLKTLTVNIATNIASTNSSNLVKSLTPRSLTKGQTIKATVRQNILRQEPPLVSQIIILSSVPSSPVVPSASPQPTQ